MLFVLPTDELFVGKPSLDHLLSKVEISLKDLIAAIVERWAEAEGGWSISGLHLMPLDASTQERVQVALMEDYLSDEQVVARLSPDDLHALTQLIRGCCHAVFEDIITILEDMHLTEYQLQTLKTVKWLGRSLVVDIHV
jgi:hypothetical protein